jgi:chemotaxis protein methyltransferase CheR
MRPNRTVTSGASDAVAREPSPGKELVTARVFRGFQAVILRESGINLSDAKRALLVGRLGRRLRELGLDSFEDYLGRVESSADERVLMLDAIATNETRFFREPGQFEFLKERVLPAWLEDAAQGKRPRRLRIWSAGCSTGEEPFSLAMLLASFFPKTWDLEILATDLSTKALARARAGVWPLERSREIPPELLKAYMLRGTGPEDGKMKAGPELRALVRFERLNLAGDNWPPDGPFDAILCRNVLIYFDAGGKRRAVARLLDRLAPGGFFFVGHAESLNGIADRMRPLMPSVYTSGEALSRGARGGAAR